MGNFCFGQKNEQPRISRTEVYVPTAHQYQSKIPVNKETKGQMDLSTNYGHVGLMNQYARQQIKREQRTEAEHQQKLAEMKSRSRESRERIMQEIDDGDREDDRRIQKQRKLQNFRDAEMRKRARDENDWKNREYEIETDRDIKRIRDEGRFDIEVNYRENQSLKERSRQLDDRLHNNEILFQQEDNARELEFQKVKQEQYEQRQRINDDYEKKREKMYEEADRRQREPNRQIEEIEMRMKRAVWNETIERNWTNRLNVLRNANQTSKKLESQCLKTRSTSTNIQDWKQAITILQKTMQNESLSMSQLYNNTGKSFLLEIQSSVDVVVEKCVSLLSALDKEASSSRLEQLTKELNRSCMAIPTLAELKRNYYREMRNNSSF